VEQKLEYNIEKLPDKDITGLNKNISTEIVTDTISESKTRKGVFASRIEETESDFGGPVELLMANLLSLLRIMYLYFVRN
jgi:hypothetical protein